MLRSSVGKGGAFADWASGAGVRVLNGDFNLDGYSDIALVRQKPGWTTVPVALSTPTGCIVQNPPVGAFADWAATEGVQVVTRDFNGDRATDIAC